MTDHRRNKISATGLDEEYHKGRWDFLDNITEMGRHGIMTSWLIACECTSSVLDLGCGAGPLYQRLEPLGLKRYVGVDLSTQALKQAEQKINSQIAELINADLNNFTPSGEPFSAVLFNEVLNYADDPADLVTRYAAFVAPNGVIALSIYAPERPQSGAHRKIADVWTRTDKSDYHILDDLTLTSHRKSATWRMRLVRPLIYNETI